MGKPCTIMATLEDIEVYESLNFASVVSYDLDALETFQSIQDDYSTGLTINRATAHPTNSQ